MTWPLVAIFVAFPLWWALGLSAFIWSIVAVPMAVALVWRRRSQAPVAIVFWFAFVSWVLLSGVQLDSLNRIITFSYRFSLYLAAAVLFLYVYNMPRSSWLDVKVLRILTIFWIIVVIGGYAAFFSEAIRLPRPFSTCCLTNYAPILLSSNSYCQLWQKCKSFLAFLFLVLPRHSNIPMSGAGTWQS